MRIVSPRGVIAVMGSGELTATMVEVHKELLQGLPKPARAVFLDTPAGFQLNSDQISQKAIEYFRVHVQQPMQLASFKRNVPEMFHNLEETSHLLRQADFVLIGPGSPTYALRQWASSPIPELLLKRIEAGACLVAASAAALTIGCHTLPVYEIYKVGEDLHWVEGLNLLEHFGLRLAVIPHWNNAEGGSHDTRFCYMGEPRFRRLESMLPEGVQILGLDEHTACIFDFKNREAKVRGVGRVTVRVGGEEITFVKGDTFPLDVFLRGGTGEYFHLPEEPAETSVSPVAEKSFWAKVHSCQAAFFDALEMPDPQNSARALLELDQLIWQADQDLENPEFIAQAREILRESIVFLSMKLAAASAGSDRLTPLVNEMVRLRDRLRADKQWQLADEVRESLRRAGVILEDTREGTRWHLIPIQEPLR